MADLCEFLNMCATRLRLDLVWLCMVCSMQCITVVHTEVPLTKLIPVLRHSAL